MKVLSSCLVILLVSTTTADATVYFADPQLNAAFASYSDFAVSLVNKTLDTVTTTRLQSEADVIAFLQKAKASIPPGLIGSFSDLLTNLLSTLFDMLNKIFKPVDDSLLFLLNQIPLLVQRVAQNVTIAAGNGGINETQAAQVMKIMSGSAPGIQQLVDYDPIIQVFLHQCSDAINACFASIFLRLESKNITIVTVVGLIIDISNLVVALTATIVGITNEIGVTIGLIFLNLEKFMAQIAVEATAVFPY